MIIYHFQVHYCVINYCPAEITDSGIPHLVLRGIGMCSIIEAISLNWSIWQRKYLSSSIVIRAVNISMRFVSVALGR